MTPEGKVKVKIKRLLDLYGAYYFMPVQMGRGAAGLDMHCIAASGVPFFIEAKSPDAKPTPRQEALIERLRKDYHVDVFVVKDEVTLAELEIWLKLMKGSDDERTRAIGASGIPISE